MCGIKRRHTRSRTDPRVRSYINRSFVLVLDPYGRVIRRALIYMRAKSAPLEAAEVLNGDNGAEGERF